MAHLFSRHFPSPFSICDILFYSLPKMGSATGVMFTIGNVYSAPVLTPEVFDTSFSSLAHNAIINFFLAQTCCLTHSLLLFLFQDLFRDPGLHAVMILVAYFNRVPEKLRYTFYPSRFVPFTGKLVALLILFSLLKMLESFFFVFSRPSVILTSKLFMFFHLCVSISLDFQGRPSSSPGFTLGNQLLNYFPLFELDKHGTKQLMLIIVHIYSLISLLD